MPRRLLAVLSLMVAILLVGAGTLYAYDRSNRERIAEGVSVEGVDLGGLTPERARAKLRQELVAPLERPVSVRHRGRRFTLTPERAEIAVDVDGSVAEALARSRAGNVLTRAWREVRGGELRADLDARVSYSQKAVEAMVERVDRRVSVDARDAEVDLEAGQIEPTPEREGVAVKERRLERDIERELLDASDTRAVRVRTSTIEPEVTVADLEKKYPTVIMVDRASFQLTLYKDLEPVETYGVALGQVGMDTPSGLYEIQNKAVDPAWNVPMSDWAGDLAGTVVPGGVPENPLKARWLGVYDGVGIHGTDAESSIGTQASHGCIRMRVPEVIELYDQVPVGSPIYIS
jgi:lipoprotein-anchoring transpeptidase ErfK/SrfK